MGRPIKKQFLGADAQEGFQLLGTAWFGGDSSATNDCIVASQSGTRKYKFVERSDSTNYDYCYLVKGAPTKAGEANILVHTATGNESARTIYQHTVHTFEGNTYAWNSDGAAQADGKVQLEGDAGHGGTGAAFAIIDVVPTATFTLTAGTVSNGGGGYPASSTIDLIISAPDAVGAVIEDLTLTDDNVDGSGALDNVQLVSDFLIFEPGQCYTGVVGVTISGGSGSGAVLQANFGSSGELTGITVLNSGSGYDEGDVLSFDIAVPAVTQAVGTATSDANGVITGVTLTTSGAGYLSATATVKV